MHTGMAEGHGCRMAFLAALQEGWSVTGAALAAGINRTLLYKLRHPQAHFREPAFLSPTVSFGRAGSVVPTRARRAAWSDLARSRTVVARDDGKPRLCENLRNLSPTVSVADDGPGIRAAGATVCRCGGPACRASRSRS